MDTATRTFKDLEDRQRDGVQKVKVSTQERVPDAKCHAKRQAVHEAGDEELRREHGFADRMLFLYKRISHHRHSHSGGAVSRRQRRRRRGRGDVQKRR